MTRYSRREARFIVALVSFAAILVVFNFLVTLLVDDLSRARMAASIGATGAGLFGAEAALCAI